MRRLLILSGGTDVAGLGYAMKSAFDRHAPDWSVRQARRVPSRWGYPVDIEWGADGRNTRLVARLFAEADVVHVMERPQIVQAFPGYQRKAIVVQHQGSYFRNDPEGVSTACQAIGATEIAAGYDLLLPHMELLPITDDLDALAQIRRRVYQPSDRVRIAHAPTNRALKSTDLIIEAVERLSRRHPIDFDLIENVPWAECLERKAAADIFVDELTLGYGSNALECWAMGIPVISGISDDPMLARLVETFGEVPFMLATPDTLERCIEVLVTRPSVRAAWGQRGYAYAQRWHSGEVVVQRAIEIYERAIRKVA